MSVQVENLDKSMAKITIEVPAEKLETALDSAYKKNRGKISLPGFRKGKAPRQMIEKMYGAGVFYEDAANIIIPDAYEDAAKESGLVIVSQPEIAIEQIEKGMPFIFTATVAVKPEVKLGDYKGIEVEKKEAEVSDAEIDTEINRVRESNSRMVTIDDRAAQEGDTVIIDFDGYADDEQFEGGKAENQPLVLGSHTFIDNFEDQIVGKNIGDEFDVNVTFPEAYHAENLRGKDAVFKVKLNGIRVKELPDIDDEFAQDVSDFDTLEEYKEDLKNKMLENKRINIKRELEDKVIEKIVDNSQMDIPEPMIEAQVNQMVQEFLRNLRAQGLSLEQYLNLTGYTMPKIMDELKPQAIKRIQNRLVLEAVVAAEDIKASDEEYDKEMENMAAMYNTEAKKLKEQFSDEDKEQLLMDIAVQKAINFVVDESISVQE